MRGLQILVIIALVSSLSEAKKRTDPNLFKKLKIPAREIRELRKEFESEGGLLLKESDSRYKDYIRPWNMNCREKPQLVILPNTYQQAAKGLELIKKHDESFVIMSGGHDNECESNTDRVLMNLALLNEVKVDEERQVAVFQSGARWEDVYKEL